MAHVLITGSAAGLGQLAAKMLVEQGHTVTLHARDEARAAAARAAVPGDVLVGDLSTLSGMRAVADAAGRYDAVIHNAGVGHRERERLETADGYSHVFATNVLAPYVLTALIERPARLVYLSSGMHRGGAADLSDAQWERKRWNGSRAYSDSKLFDAVLAAAIARRWPDVRSNAVDPGWVPTKMGGPGAPDDLELGAATQAWLAVSDDPAALGTGGYLYHQRPHTADAAVADARFGEELLAYCESLSGFALPA